MTKVTQSQETLLNEIKKYQFAAVELVLFLDTHPDDAKAIEMHMAIVKKAAKLTTEYEETYGPITSNANTSKSWWTWIDGPWPWEN